MGTIIIDIGIVVALTVLGALEVMRAIDEGRNYWSHAGLYFVVVYLYLTLKIWK